MLAAMASRFGSPSPHSYGERVMAKPCLRHEVRGGNKGRSERLPLTLALSPRKSGERGPVAHRSMP
jgi:hypothetical protein